MVTLLAAGNIHEGMKQPDSSEALAIWITSVSGAHILSDPVL